MASVFDPDSFEMSVETDGESSSSSSSLSAWLSEDNLGPIATEREAEEYANQVAREEEEELRLLERFSGSHETTTWCKCNHCDLAYITKHEECSCCLEYDRCREKMEEIDKPSSCITSHPAFEDICLKTWVLETAAIGLRTREKTLYTKLRQQGRRTDSKFFRAVSYRQFMRFLYEYVGNSRRLALPCCVYNKIRHAFPDESNTYRGFEQDPDDDQEYSSEEEDTEQP